MIKHLKNQVQITQPRTTMDTCHIGAECIGSGLAKIRTRL